MEPDAKPPFIQFHLSTAIVMMFAAGGVLYLNCRPRFDAGVQGRLFEACYGWPGTCLRHSDWSRSKLFKTPLVNVWSEADLIANIIWAIIILTAVFVVTELINGFLSRRWHRRSPEESQ